MGNLIVFVSRDQKIEQPSLQFASRRVVPVSVKVPVLLGVVLQIVKFSGAARIIVQLPFCGSDHLRVRVLGGDIRMTTGAGVRLVGRGPEDRFVYKHRDPLACRVGLVKRFVGVAFEASAILDRFRGEDSRRNNPQAGRENPS